MGRAFRQENPVGATSILVDDELVGIVSRRAYEADRILRSLEILKGNATKLLAAIEQAQEQ